MKQFLHHAIPILVRMEEFVTILPIMRISSVPVLRDGKASGVTRTLMNVHKTHAKIKEHASIILAGTPVHAEQVSLELIARQT